MPNLTITVDEETLRRARIRALERGTSVNRILAEYLRMFAGTDEAAADAVRDLVRLARQAESGSGPGGRRWTRDELHER